MTKKKELTSGERGKPEQPDIADRDEIMRVLTGILRGRRKETYIKAVHKKESYYDAEGRKCTSDNEVLEQCECDAKLSDLWRVCDLMCRLNGVDTGSAAQTVIIEGAEELE